MSAGLLLKAILAASWAEYLWDLYIGVRQFRVHESNEKRPDKVKELISEEDYVKARAYKLDKHRFGFAKDLFDQLLLTVKVLAGYYPLMWYSSTDLPMSLAVFTVYNMVFDTIVDLPWDLYSTFVIEQTHGFNKQTPAFFFTELAKTWAISGLLTIPIMYAIEYIVTNGGPYFFLYVWGFLSVAILALTIIYPTVIAPIFDSYIPLPDGELKTRIEALASSVQFPLTKLYVVYGSKRSSHSNAYMYGFWKSKRIVLYDTLLSGVEREKVVEDLRKIGQEVELTDKDKEKGVKDDEIVAILGHELGHWALSHTLIMLFIGELNLLFVFAVSSYFYNWELLYQAFGFHDTPVLIGLMLVIKYILSISQKLASIAITLRTRSGEFAADEYAHKLGHGENLISGLIKLGTDNLSMPIDDWLFSWCTHSHPPIIERVAALRALDEKAK